MSRWERGRGLPGLSLLEPPASALQVSVPALLSGELAANDNRSANMLKSKLYVRPICGNLFTSYRERTGRLLRDHPAAAGAGSSRRSTPCSMRPGRG